METSADLLKLLGDCRRALVRFRTGGLPPTLPRELEARLTEAENKVADITTLLTRDQAYMAVQHHDGLAEEIAAELQPQPTPAVGAPCGGCGGLGYTLRGPDTVTCPWCSGTGGAL